MSLNIDELLKDLKDTKTAEEMFQEKLAESSDANNAEADVDEVKIAEKATDDSVAAQDEEDILKLAEHFVDQGRLMARGFIAELEEYQTKQAGYVQPDEDASEYNEEVKTASTIMNNIYKKITGGKN